VKDVLIFTVSSSKLQVSAKNDELQLAAELGKQMLERNDELQEKLDNLQQNHSNLVEVSPGEVKTRFIPKYLQRLQL
jgi:hypothetical protein